MGLSRLCTAMQTFTPSHRGAEFSLRFSSHHWFIPKDRPAGLDVAVLGTFPATLADTLSSASFGLDRARGGTVPLPRFSDG